MVKSKFTELANWINTKYVECDDKCANGDEKEKREACTKVILVGFLDGFLYISMFVGVVTSIYGWCKGLKKVFKKWSKAGGCDIYHGLWFFSFKEV